MTTPSHTELAALAQAISEALTDEFAQGRISNHTGRRAASMLQQLAAALESPERVQGETCHYPDCNCPTENPCLKGLPTPPTAPAQYSLPDELYDSKDWKAADYAGRVEWLHAMYEAKKMELESFLTLATPSPQAEKQPLSEADEALMRDALRTAYLLHSISYMYRGIQVSWSDKHEDALKQADQSIEALRKRLESSNAS